MNPLPQTPKPPGFAGRDGSRAFHTGEFSDTGLVESLQGLPDDAYVALDDWLSFYHKDYIFVGRLAGGHYYDARGGGLDRLLYAHFNECPVQTLNPEP
jgi:hypothetical protein